MNINPISGNYVIPKGFAFARFAGNDYFEELGDMDAFETSVEVERDERKDNRFGVARTSDSQVTDIGVTVSMTLMQHTNRNRALAVMGSNGVMTQTAETALTKTFENTVANQFYGLDRFDVTITSVTDELDNNLVLGVDYTVDAKSGVIQPLKVFEEFVVTYGCAAILPASNRLKTGVGGNPDIEAELLLVGNNLKGQKVHVRLWKVRLTPSSGRGYIGNERAGIEIEGECLADAVKALAEGNSEEYAFGVEQTLAG